MVAKRYAVTSKVTVGWAVQQWVVNDWRESNNYAFCLNWFISVLCQIVLNSFPNNLAILDSQNYGLFANNFRK